MEFVHLHLHTEYSLLDGCCRIGRLFDAVKKNNQTAVAITDHGVMYGAVEFYKAAKSAGIKPIIGCEVYVAARSRFDKDKFDGNNYSHLVLLCENETGYKNLIKLVSLGFTEGFYSKPRVDRELLKQYHEGIIALSACLAGDIPRKLIKDDYNGAKEEALFYESIFGKGNFFLELQDHGIDEQKRINPLIIKLSRELNIPLVATNDVHYVDKEDEEMHNVLLCIQTGKKIIDTDRLEFKTNEFYLKSSEEMESLFSDVPEAILNTKKIADRCNFDFEFGKIKLPRFDIGDKDHFEYFKEKCYDGLYRIYGKNPDKKLTERLDYELSVIDKMGYVDYYLIVQDYVNYAKNNGIPVGPGRGSGAGSLSAYCIGITGIDPIKYDLIFERFLNPERVSMPDFDVDFCYVNRQKVIDYVIKKYGADHVSQIITFGTMAARGSVRDVGRVLDIPYALCDKVAKLIPTTLGITISKALQVSKELSDLYNSDENVKRIIDMAEKIEGMPRHASTHAAGVVISDKRVDEYVPLAKNDEAIVTQYVMTSLDELGLLKMDFLGLRNLTVIADTEAEIRKKIPNFSSEKIPENDEETIKMMGNGLTEGVFQFESEGMKNVLRSFKPESIEDLIAILSLYRPGPMDSIPKYIHNRFHPEDITYPTPLLEPILKVTYGCIVYQEQVMQVFRSLAGYSLGRADIVRRAMSKKKHEVMAKERKAFIYGETDSNGNIICKGCVNNSIDEKVAEEIFDNMSAFSSYAFNKSHAAAYGVVAYRTAYLKCHYPKEYMAALLTSVLDSFDKITEYTSECQRLGIKILPPDVNESMQNFTPTPNGIRFGLLAIKNLGRGIIERIINERNLNGKYTSLYDFCKRNYSREFNRRAVEGLIKSGALDALEKTRRQMLFGIDFILNAVENNNRFTSGGQMDLFSADNSTEEISLPYYEEMPKKELLTGEKEATGLYLSGHPCADYVGYARSINAFTVRQIFETENPEGKRVCLVALLSAINVKQLKNGNLLALCTAEDVTGEINIVAFNKVYLENKSIFSVGNIVKIIGRLSEHEDRPVELICDMIEYVNPSKENYKPKIEKGLYLKISSQNSPEFSQICDILNAFKGNEDVIIYCVKEHKKLKSSSLKVNVTQKLIEELQKILNIDDIKHIK